MPTQHQQPAPNRSKYLVLSPADPFLPNSRVLTAGTNITLTDAGAGGTLTIAAAGGSGAPGGSPTQIQYNLAGAFAGATGSAVDANGAVTIGPTAGVALLLNLVAGQYGLSVEGDANTQYTMRLRSTSATSGRNGILFLNSGAVTQQWALGNDITGTSTGAFSLRNITAASVPLSVTTAGNWSIAASSSGTPLTVTSLENVANTILKAPNTGGGWNLQFFDTTGGVNRGVIGVGTNTMTGATATDFIISPGAAGSVQISRANGGVSAATFGPAGNVTINAPSSGVATTINGFAGAVATTIKPGNSASVGIQILDPGVNATELRLNTTNTAVQIQATGVAVVPMNFLMGASATLAIATTGAVSIAAPTSSAVALTVNAAAANPAATLVGVANSMMFSLEYPTSVATGAYLRFRDTTNALDRGYIGSGTTIATGAAISDFVVAAKAGNLVLSSDGGVTSPFKLATTSNAITHTAVSGTAVTVTGAANSTSGLFTAGTGGANTFQVANTGSASGDTSRVAVVADTAGATNCSLFAAPAAQAAAIITNGPTGAQAVLRNLGAHPLLFGTNNTLRATIGSTGAISIAQPTSGNALTLPAGTTAIAPLVLTSGTNLTAAAAGVVEYDGTNSYFTNETTSGRGLVPVEQFFHLAAAGTGITTIANFFGTTSNISLVANAFYEIEIVAFFTMGTTGSVVTWTLTNSAAPTDMALVYEMSPITGVVAPPGTATLLSGQIVGGTTAAQTVVTGSLTASTKQYARFRIMLKNGTGTSLKIQLAETTTTTALTPNIGSYWRCKRIPSGNVGTFAA